MNKRERKRKLNKIKDLYLEVVDISLMEALASCAIEGNSGYFHLGKIFGYLWGRIKEEPSDEAIDFIYGLFTKLEERKGKNEKL